MARTSRTCRAVGSRARTAQSSAAPTASHVAELGTTTFTENGAPSLASTGSARVNLFFKLTRDVTANPRFEQWLAESWAEDPLDTLRLIFHGRDCRGGKGDRAAFIAALSWVRDNHPAAWFEQSALPHVPHFGRFLDWVELYAAAPSPPIVALVYEQLRADVAAMDDGGGVSLLAKWLPSEGKKWDRNGLLREICRAFFSVPASAPVSTYHRRLLRKEVLGPLRAHLALVERAMCAGSWEAIDYSKVPSVAMNRLKKAFARHSPERFAAFKAALATGEAKVNSSQVDAHDLVRQYLDSHEDGPDEVVEAQWRGLEAAARELGSLEHTLAMCDVSGSMYGVPMDVSIALGVLISSLTSASFRGMLLTFDNRPQLHQIPPDATSLYAKVQSVKDMPWGMSTDLHAAMRLVLTRAAALGLRPEEMPRRLVILSDMQFDCAVGGQSGTQFECIRRDFAAAGFRVPDIVFWNLRSDTTVDVPVTFDEQGVALLSGFRPALLKQVIEADGLTPFSIMRAAIDDPRYARIVAPGGPGGATAPAAAEAPAC